MFWDERKNVMDFVRFPTLLQCDHQKLFIFNLKNKLILNLNFYLLIVIYEMVIFIFHSENRIM